MNDLNAQQIVLLTLLVSFVTSIATGIVTVSLLEQAPEPVTQTINRVVEKTIERVVTEPAQEGEKIIERETVTVVVNEEDLTIEAINKNSKSLVRFYEKISDTEKRFITLGMVIDANGDFLIPNIDLNDKSNYLAVYSSGEFAVNPIKKKNNAQFAILSLVEDAANPIADDFKIVGFADSDKVQLGQSIIALAGSDRNAVFTGIINRIDSNTENQTQSFLTSIDSKNLENGSFIMNLRGDIIGFNVLSINADTLFIPANMVKDFLNESGSVTIAE